MKRAIWTVVVVIMAVASISSAESVRGIDIEFVGIGSPGNPADTGGTVGCGAVDYPYAIGKYEITNGQWNAFVAAAGVPTGDDEGYSYNAFFNGADKPTTGVSWYEALQFCNYLTTGDKSQGAYLFSGDNSNPGSFVSIDRESALADYVRIFVLPTEDEWYKAAYYKPDGSGYSHYASGTNTPPVAGVNSNFDGAVGQPWTVGDGTEEQNKTFDMMGNVWEWNETLIGGARGIRGDGYVGHGGLAATDWGAENPSLEWEQLSFRIVSVQAIPEPTSLCGAVIGLSVLGVNRLRSRKKRA